MRYKIEKDIIIRSENAAKPEQQGSAYLRSMISNLASVSRSFDYGCGKLRYRDAILETTDTLALIDSEIQLSRTQSICGVATTVRATIQKTNRVVVYNTNEFAKTSMIFDRGFCINVLSVIPTFSARRRALRLILGKLRPGGTCLFAVQYRNSDFDRMRKMPNAQPWRDGFLIDSLRGFSFYGLISPDHLARMIEQAGFEVADCILNQGTAYLTARAAKTNKHVVFEGVDETKNFSFIRPSSK